MAILRPSYGSLTAVLRLLQLSESQAISKNIKWSSCILFYIPLCTSALNFCILFDTHVSIVLKRRLTESHGVFLSLRKIPCNNGATKLTKFPDLSNTPKLKKLYVFVLILIVLGFHISSLN